MKKTALAAAVLAAFLCAPTSCTAGNLDPAKIRVAESIWEVTLSSFLSVAVTNGWITPEEHLEILNAQNSLRQALDRVLGIIETRLSEQRAQQPEAPAPQPDQ